MTFWEYRACLDGWNRSQGSGHGNENQPLTDEQYDALCDIMDNL